MSGDMGCVLGARDWGRKGRCQVSSSRRQRINQDWGVELDKLSFATRKENSQ